MNKTYLLPNIITAFGLTCGLFVIFKMNMIDPGDVTQHILLGSAGILILAAIADLLDGAIARAMKVEGEFGALFDSLADAITFGVAPSIVVLKTLSIKPGTELSFAMTAAAMIYTVCGVLRLIRYNVTSAKAKSEAIDPAVTKNFTGLPIPAAAGAAISLNLLLVVLGGYKDFAFSQLTNAWILFGGLVLLGYLMVSRWRFPSLKTLHIRVASFQMVFITVLAAVIIFYGIFYHFAPVFFLLCWGYIVVSLVLSLIRITTGKKSKTLEDFEPESDHEHDS